MKTIKSFGLFKTPVVVFVLTAVIFSCKKNDEYEYNPPGNNTTCNTPSAPSALNNSPVIVGQTIQLYADTIANVAYQWTGPNSFSSTEQNPVIVNASQLHAGTYTVTVTVSGGCSNYAGTTVSVISPSASCNPPENEYTLSGFPSVSFSTNALQFGVGVSGNYEITCNGILGDINLEFAVPAKPVEGIYRVTQLGSLAEADEVKISITMNSSYWTTPSGYLFVTTLNGKNTYVFCDLDFGSPTWSLVTAGSGKIIEP